MGGRVGSRTEPAGISARAPRPLRCPRRPDRRGPGWYPAATDTARSGPDTPSGHSRCPASGTTNTISDNRSSIRQGIQTLTENLYLAQEKGVDVWTAVQAYNFGPAYIDFIAQNGKENTLALAKQYSRETVAPILGNTTGETYTYLNPISLFSGAELYVDGGNYYYSRQVRLNLYIIKFFNLFLSIFPFTFNGISSSAINRVGSIYFGKILPKYSKISFCEIANCEV